MTAKFDNLSKINVCLISISHLQSQGDSSNIMYFLTVTMHIIVQSTVHFDLQTYLCYKYNYNSYSYFTTYKRSRFKKMAYCTVRPCMQDTFAPVRTRPKGQAMRARDDRVSFIQRTSVNFKC